MSDEIQIRESWPGDAADIELLYPEAFPEEDLLPVVRELLADPVAVTSLVATIDRRIAGHVIFTACGVEGGSVRASMLGPLGVVPSRQKQGIGSAIVNAGLERLEDAGVGLVCVLGDPAYYSRFGFLPESDVAPPYPLPEEWVGAWQSLRLGTDRRPCAGKLLVPDPWLKPELWLP